MEWRIFRRAAWWKRYWYFTLVNTRPQNPVNKKLDQGEKKNKKKLNNIWWNGINVISLTYQNNNNT
jgi:hypothetical protein